MFKLNLKVEPKAFYFNKNDMVIKKHKKKKSKKKKKKKKKKSFMVIWLYNV